MGRKFLTTPTLPTLSSAPSSPSVGDMYFDTTLGKIGVYTASGWVYNLHQIEDGSITTSKIADGAVTPSKLAPGAAIANIGYTPVNKAGDTMSGPLDVSGNVRGIQFISTATTGTPPLQVSSTTKVTNLNADLLDGYDASTSATTNTIAVRDNNGYLNAFGLIGSNTANLLINAKNHGIEIRIDEDNSGHDTFRITKGSSGSITLLELENSGSLNIRNTINIGGFDLSLGTSDQVTRGNSGPSRALVKDHNATLVINYSGDFTGGVRVDGPGMTITGNLNANSATLAGRTFRKVSFVPSNGVGWYRIIANTNVFGGRLDIHAEWNARVSRITIEGHSAGWDNVGYFTATQVFHYDAPLITQIRWGQSGGETAYLDIYVANVDNNNNLPVNLYFWGDAWSGIQTTPQFNPPVDTTNFVLHFERKGGSTYNQSVKVLGNDFIGWGNLLIEFRTDSNIIQWGIGHKNIPGANNSGNDFAIFNYSNDGSYLSQPFTIRRSNGFVGINSLSPDHRLTVEEFNSRIVTVIRKTNSHNGGGSLDGPTLLIENSYGNHSWGNLAEFRIGNNGGLAPPNITFTAGWASTGWAVGMAGYNDADFGIASNRGWRFGNFGTVQLRIKPDGQVITSGTITPGISGGFAGNINSSGPIKFSNGPEAQEIYVRKIRASECGQLAMLMTLVMAVDFLGERCLYKIIQGGTALL